MIKDKSDRPQPLKDLEGLPVFEEEWQAQTLAMVDAMITNKSIEADCWSEAFGVGLKDARAAGKPDDLATYYAVALDTLQMLMTEQCQVTTAEISKKREAWKQAYLRTPHGQPVIL